jgi:lipoprotein-releasing system permease protein
MIVTAALIVVLSVFNGFETMVERMFNSFNPDLKIEIVQGKTFDERAIPLEKIKQVPGVMYVTRSIEENALITYRNKQYIATIKGVSSEFDKTTSLDSSITEGLPTLEQGSSNFAVVGEGVAYFLGLNLNDYENPLNIYAPRKQNEASTDLSQAFNNLDIAPSGIFSVQQEFDQKYVIVPLRFARNILESDSLLSSLEIRVDKKYEVKKVQKALQELLGTNYSVKDHFEQEALMYKVMRAEKLAVFIILSFILLIAVFNVIGSISMLIIDKKKDIAVFKALGASDKNLRSVFFLEGMLITVSGGIIGLVIGGVIAWIQQYFGLIKITAGATFAVDAYPVKIIWTDFVWVSATVFFIGFLASWYPVKLLMRRNRQERLG